MRIELVEEGPVRPKTAVHVPNENNGTLRQCEVRSVCYTV